jgi:hypothetical protein
MIAIKTGGVVSPLDIAQGRGDAFLLALEHAFLIAIGIRAFFPAFEFLAYPEFFGAIFLLVGIFVALIAPEMMSSVVVIFAWSAGLRYVTAPTSRPPLLPPWMPSRRPGAPSTACPTATSPGTCCRSRGPSPRRRDSAGSAGRSTS